MTEPETPPAGEPGWWRKARAGHASVIIDAADYFRFARAAMLTARKRIMLVGWDFDARIKIERQPGDHGPERIGDFLTWMVDRTPDLEVYLLRWDIGALKTLLHGRTLWTLMQWVRRRRIHPRLDSHHPSGASHHQKLIVIDDCLAFCGGIDMTANRWDTPSHQDGDPRRLRPNGKPARPWHDAAWAVDGAAAAALGALARGRWRESGGGELDGVYGLNGCWPDGLPVGFTDVDIAISRTIPELCEREATLEIEQLYLDQIDAARRHLYIESQYFASRRIAERIAGRLREPDPPEIVIINPVQSDGWLQTLAMDSARARLVETLRRLDSKQRLRIYHPHTAAGDAIYVHAKLLIADDRILRVGSSNMNNRSLRLDTECDLTIDALSCGQADVGPAIRAIRDGLIAEHLGQDAAEVSRLIDEEGSMIAAIEAMRGEGKTLVPYEVPDLDSVSQWLADNEVLDPEGPSEMFEPLTKRGLFRGRLGKMRAATVRALSHGGRRRQRRVSGEAV